MLAGNDPTRFFGADFIRLLLLFLCMILDIYFFTLISVFFIDITVRLVHGNVCDCDSEQPK
jgi:hypothetical protein